MTTQLEIDITPAGADLGDADPKTLREWLFTRLLRGLETEAERAEPGFKPDSFLVPREMGRLVDYLEARSRAMALRQAARLVQRAIQGREEYLIFDRANSHCPPPTDAELECARHHDRCTVCMAHEAVSARLDEEIQRLEAVRRIHVEGISRVLAAISNSATEVRAGEEPSLTLPQIEKALNSVSESAYRRWQKRGRL